MSNVSVERFPHLLPIGRRFATAMTKTKSRQAFIWRVDITEAAACWTDAIDSRGGAPVQQKNGANGIRAGAAWRQERPPNWGGHGIGADRPIKG